MSVLEFFVPCKLQLIADITEAWNAPLIIEGDSEYNHTDSDAEMVFLNLQKVDDSFAEAAIMCVRQVYEWDIVYWMRRPSTGSALNAKVEALDKLTSLLCAGPNYAEHGFLPIISSRDLSNPGDFKKDIVRVSLTFRVEVEITHH